MQLAVLLILAHAHVPGPADFVRFGLELTPPDRGYANAQLRVASHWLHAVESHHRMKWPLDPLYWHALRMDARWRVECWYNAARLTRMSFRSCEFTEFDEEPGRNEAARNLRDLLGPLDYYRGRLPDPWPDRGPNP